MIQLLLLLLVTAASSHAASTKPNILFIMADDLGWNDVSWNNIEPVDEMQTPELYKLAHNNAAILDNAYVNQACSITRSAFLTGKYPFLMGTQSTVFAPMEPSGVPEDLPFIPEYLRDKAGYRNYMIGKWHLGHCKDAYLPNNRGFDWYFGFYNGGQDYFTHETSARDGAITGFDFWLQQSDVSRKYADKYSTELFGAATKFWIGKHNELYPEDPFFFFLSFQAVRCPLQDPPETNTVTGEKTDYFNGCTQDDSNRKTYCAMMQAVDTAVGDLVQFLKDKELYDNTIIIFSTDNGGNTLHGGNNWPYRGNKGTLWEGGTKAVSFVHSPKYITNPGKRTQLFHIVDWFATIKRITGSTDGCYGDGIDQWDMITTGVTSNARNDIVYNVDQCIGSAIRVGKYKYIVGSAGTPSTWVKSDGTKAYGKINLDTTDLEELLYDLEEDPYELDNLADAKYGDTYTDIIADMKEEIKKLWANEHPSIHYPSDSKGNPQNQEGDLQGTFAHGWCEDIVLEPNTIECSVDSGTDTDSSMIGCSADEQGTTETPETTTEEAEEEAGPLSYPIVDTGLTRCFDSSGNVLSPCPSEGEAHFGQDGCYQGLGFSFQDNGDGTVSDLNTGLMWQQDPGTKTNLADAQDGLSTFNLAGYSDWRIPTVKELYSLIDFNGKSAKVEERAIPYIDTSVFGFEYGDEENGYDGERLIDSQALSQTLYVSTTMRNTETMFGVNFADGRIKGYPKVNRKCTQCYFLYHVRGNSEYGLNKFVDNGDGTITDQATGLMWLQEDSGKGLDFEEALSYAEDLEFAGFDDWRVPNAKELQSLIDYSQYSPSIDDQFFLTSSITNEAGEEDYPYFWSSTTHLEGPGDSAAVYVAFGRAIGYMDLVGDDDVNEVYDVHGAGSQKSDPKTGDPADWEGGHGPQNDAIRIYNYVRPVRNV